LNVFLNGHGTWQMQHSVTGQHHRPAILASTTSQQYWPAPLANNTAILASTAGQQYWPAIVASHWSAALAITTGQHHWLGIV
jgi:hypothetical protein